MHCWCFLLGCDLLTPDWCVNSMSLSVHSSDHMVQGNFSPILTHGSSLPLPLSAHLPPTPSLFYPSERRPAGGRGPDLKKRKEGREREKKRKESRDQRSTRQSRGLPEEKHSLTLAQCVRLPSASILLYVCVSRWDFDGTVSNASHAATAGWQ